MAIRYAPVLALAIIVIGVAILSYFMTHYANVKVSSTLLTLPFRSSLRVNAPLDIASHSLGSLTKKNELTSHRWQNSTSLLTPTLVLSTVGLMELSQSGRRMRDVVKRRIEADGYHIVWRRRRRSVLRQRPRRALERRVLRRVVLKVRRSIILRRRMLGV